MIDAVESKDCALPIHFSSCIISVSDPYEESLSVCSQLSREEIFLLLFGNFDK